MKLIICFNESAVHGECTLFLDGDINKVIGCVHDNDATWRHEYFDGILKQVGLEVEEIEMESDVFDELAGKYLGF